MLTIQEFIYTFFDAVLYAAAVSFMILFVSSGFDITKSAEKCVNVKVNVYEKDGEYSEGSEVYVTAAAVLSDVSQVEDGIPVTINGYSVTQDDFERLKLYHDASSLADKVKSSRKYQKEYRFDSMGQVSEIIYNQV